MLAYAGLCLLGLGVFRLALVGFNFTRIEPALLPQLLLHGLRFDFMTVAHLLVPPLLLSAFSPPAAAPALSKLLRGYYRIALVWLMAMEAIGVGFIVEYDHRPDQLFWDYLAYPQEVSQMLLRGFGAEILGVLVTIALACVIGNHRLMTQPIRLGTALSIANALCFCVLTVVLAAGIRSSFGHRPANISSALFSNNRLANELALNSGYTSMYALYAGKNSVDNRKLYGGMPLVDAIATVFDSQRQPRPELPYRELPTVRTITPDVALTRPRNVVIILEESMGSRFVGCLGGRALTPNLCDISRSGVLFENLYATGTRTVRGIEAVLSGYPPSASESVVKRTKSRRDFFTLALALRPHGYRSFFLYGGEPNFDDMGSFMLGNGFDEIIAGAAAYPDAQFKGSWGVSDEDWARKAHQVFSKAQAQGPFFGLMLSTSNHTPWEYPAGRIQPVGPAATRDNSVRYADYAIGEFFKLARSSTYFDDTVFLIVADHDDRVFGSEFVPIDHFRIPGVLIAPGLAPRRESRIASQIDLMPTILPLLGVPLETPGIGQNLFAESLTGPGRALMQYGMNNALMVGDAVVVHLPGKPALHFRYRNGALQAGPANPVLEHLALAYLSVAHDLYAEELYRLPTPEQQASASLPRRLLADSLAARSRLNTGR